jgi:predicted dehydrogenase
MAFPRAIVFEQADAALAAGGDLAIIASPPKFHLQHTTAALEAGLDVLCEKPMAASVDDCEAMIEAARRLDRILAAGHYKRFFPVHRAIKHFIEGKTFGALQSVAIAEGGKFGWPAASDSFFRKEQTPGGVLLDIGVHVLDLLLWWLGEPLEFSYQDDALDGLEANALLNASFSNGITATVRLSRDWGTLNTYTFRFDRATVHLRVNQANRVEITLDGLPMTFAAELREPVDADFPRQTPPVESNPQAFIAQLVDVIGSIRDRRPPLVPGSEGVRPIRWIQQCYDRRQSLATPWMQEQLKEETCGLR